MRLFHFFLAAFFLACSPALAWDGIDEDSEIEIEIEEGNLVRSGNDIEFYDFNDDTYHRGEVQSITRTHNSVDVEIYDYDNDEIRTLMMDDNQ